MSKECQMPCGRPAEIRWMGQKHAIEGEDCADQKTAVRIATTLSNGMEGQHVS